MGNEKTAQDIKKENLQLQEKIKRLSELQSEMNGSPTLSTEEVYGFDEKGKAVLSHRKLIVAPRQASSVEFSMDSKGQIKPNVKVYHEDPYKALEISLALMKEAVDSSHDLFD